MLLLGIANALLQQSQHVELSDETRVSLGTAFAVLGPIAAGAAGGVAWLMRRFKKSDEKRETGFAAMQKALLELSASVEAMRGEMRALREESYETWCAHMMESYNLRVQNLNPKLKMPDIRAMEIIAQARASRSRASTDEAKKGAA